MNYTKPSIVDVTLMDDKGRSLYFHDMSENSRPLELLLHTAYNNEIIPSIASPGEGPKSLAYIIFHLNPKKLNIIGCLMDLTTEIPNCEFNIRSDSTSKIYVELSCDPEDGDQMFTRIKEEIEDNMINTNHTHNYQIMSTVYNIAKITEDVIKAQILFATNAKLYTQGKCGMSIYKEKQNTKVSIKNAVPISSVIEEIKTKAALNLPTVFFCTFEELRNFYFELDDTVYGKEDE